MIGIRTAGTAVLIALLASGTAAAAPASASVSIRGDVTAHVTDFIVTTVGYASSAKKTYNLVLESNPMATMKPGGSHRVHAIHFSFPAQLKPGTYRVRGKLALPGRASAAHAPVVASYICEAMGPSKGNGCGAYFGHAAGTLTLENIGRKISGHFKYKVKDASGRNSVSLQGRFNGVPVRN